MLIFYCFRDINDISAILIELSGFIFYSNDK